MGKEKTPSKAETKKTETVESDDEMDYEESLKFVSAVSHPLAPKKLNKKILKLVKKATSDKQVKRGVREVVKTIRKGGKGLVVMAGDISPMDVITHIPVLCEESGIAYIFVPSKNQLGVAGGTKRPTSCILISKSKVDGYEECYEQAEKLCAVKK